MKGFALARHIIEQIGEEYGISIGQLTNLPHFRSKTYLAARLEAWRLIREQTELSYPEIAELFDCDHSTVIKRLNTSKRQTRYRKALSEYKPTHTDKQYERHDYETTQPRT